jgi:hypothetical protein
MFLRPGVNTHHPVGMTQPLVGDPIAGKRFR